MYMHLASHRNMIFMAMHLLANDRRSPVFIDLGAKVGAQQTSVDRDIKQQESCKYESHAV
jgi:hypothetical protein